MTWCFFYGDGGQIKPAPQHRRIFEFCALERMEITQIVRYSKFSEEHACNHDRDHEHDHCCIHDHDHAYDHNREHKHGVTTRTSLALPRVTIELESHNHEQAEAVSADVMVQNGCRIAFEKIVLAMQDIAWEVERAGRIVGHLKVSAREGEVIAHASVTAPSLPPEGEYDSGIVFSCESWIQAAAIALLIDREVLERIVASAFRDNL